MYFCFMHERRPFPPEFWAAAQAHFEVLRHPKLVVIVSSQLMTRGWTAAKKKAVATAVVRVEGEQAGYVLRILRPVKGGPWSAALVKWWTVYAAVTGGLAHGERLGLYRGGPRPEDLAHLGPAVCKWQAELPAEMEMELEGKNQTPPRPDGRVDGLGGPLGRAAARRGSRAG